MMEKDKSIENLTEGTADVATDSQDKAEVKKNHDDEPPTLREVIREQATEYDAPLTSNLTLRKILGGDILDTRAVRRQIWLFLLIVFFIIVYIANRYSCQQDLIQIEALQKELQDSKFKALSSTSEITEKSRQSNVLEMMKDNKDSTLHIADQPPYIINVPEQ